MVIFHQQQVYIYITMIYSLLNIGWVKGVDSGPKSTSDKRQERRQKQHSSTLAKIKPKPFKGGELDSQQVDCCNVLYTLI